MKDWTAIAHATLPDIPSEDLDRLLAPLAALEETFRPMANGLTPDVEPAVHLRLEENGK